MTVKLYMSITIHFTFFNGANIITNVANICSTYAEGDGSRRDAIHISVLN